MFTEGFLGTSAPLYMDIVTIYFVLLPFLLAKAIKYAIDKEYDQHFKWQLGSFILTLVIIVVFEIGVRVSGGFLSFMEESNVNYSFMVIFLITHIMIALISIILWSALIYGAVKNYRLENKTVPSLHKKIGQYTFSGITITSITGVMIYFFLFIF